MDHDVVVHLKQLLDAHTITEEETVRLSAAILALEEDYHVRVTGVCGGMFISHMAMMIERLRNGEDVCPLEPGLLKKLAAEPRYQELLPAVEELSRRCGVPFIPNEAVYIGLHLCAMEVATKTMQEQTQALYFGEAVTQ